MRKFMAGFLIGLTIGLASGMIILAQMQWRADETLTPVPPLSIPNEVIA